MPDMTPTSSRSEFLEELSAAFSGVRRDPEISLHQAQLVGQALSQPAAGAEWAAAGRRDGETAWFDVPSASLDECDGSLCHLSAEGWRFYIPAYMRRSLERFSAPQFEAGLLHAVLFHLTYRHEFHRETFGCLTPAQRVAIKHFLQLIEREALDLLADRNQGWEIYGEVQAALQSFWVSEPG